MNRYAFLYGLPSVCRRHGSIRTAFSRTVVVIRSSKARPPPAAPIHCPYIGGQRLFIHCPYIGGHAASSLAVTSRTHTLPLHRWPARLLWPRPAAPIHCPYIGGQRLSSLAATSRTYTLPLHRWPTSSMAVTSRTYTLPLHRWPASSLAATSMQTARECSGPIKQCRTESRREMGLDAPWTQEIVWYP